MPLYRARPNHIEARIYDPENSPDTAVDIADWAGAEQAIDATTCALPTAFGLQWIDAGDYIIKESHGEFRAVKPAIFHACYEPVQIEDSSLAERLITWARRQKAG